MLLLPTAEVNLGGNASALDRGRESSVGMGQAITTSSVRGSRVIVTSSSGGSTSSAPASSLIASVGFEELPGVETPKSSSNSPPSRPA